MAELTKLFTGPSLPHITADVCTKDRYTDTLPLTLMSIAAQTKRVNQVIIYDDSVNRKDMREIEILRYAFERFDSLGIQWSVQFGYQRGQHLGHQIIQEMAQDLVWRIDDDEMADHNVLECLLSDMKQGVGAAAGLVLPPSAPVLDHPPNIITKLDTNCQWYRWGGYKECEHLYSSYLYRKGIQDFDTNLSPVAHHEETLHTYGIYKKGFKLIVDGRALTWHLRNSAGGIRTGNREDWERDEIAFQETMREYEGKKVVFLDCGMGDHVVFKKAVLPKIKEKYKDLTLALCYPDIFPGEKCISIAEGAKICNPTKHNVYKFCIDNNWKTELKYAYAKLYGVTID
jgi:hypothetical protein